jgi:hypothetical protein
MSQPASGRRSVRRAGPQINVVHVLQHCKMGIGDSPARNRAGSRPGLWARPARSGQGSAPHAIQTRSHLATCRPSLSLSRRVDGAALIHSRASRPLHVPHAAAPCGSRPESWGQPASARPGWPGVAARLASRVVGRESGQGWPLRFRHRRNPIPDRSPAVRDAHAQCGAARAATPHAALCASAEAARLRLPSLPATTALPPKPVATETVGCNRDLSVATETVAAESARGGRLPPPKPAHLHSHTGRSRPRAAYATSLCMTHMPLRASFAPKPAAFAFALLPGPDPGSDLAGQSGRGCCSQSCGGYHVSQPAMRCMGVIRLRRYQRSAPVGGVRSGLAAWRPRRPFHPPKP